MKDRPCNLPHLNTAQKDVQPVCSLILVSGAEISATERSLIHKAQAETHRLQRGAEPSGNINTCEDFCCAPAIFGFQLEGS